MGARVRWDHAVAHVTDWERSNAFYAGVLGASWEGAAEEAAAHLEAHGVAVELGPVERHGLRGIGSSVYFRDPDGSLLELTSYVG